MKENVKESFPTYFCLLFVFFLFSTGKLHLKEMLFSFVDHKALGIFLA